MTGFVTQSLIRLPLKIQNEQVLIFDNGPRFG